MANNNSVITRRKIVQGAALAPALVPFATAAGTAANSAVKVGLIGAGGRGTTLSRLLTSNTRARVVALADVKPEAIEKAKQKIPVDDPRVYMDFRKLLASDVDAVIIATPVYLHPEHFEAAAKAGKHIYVEKPAGVDVAGCKRIMKAADSANPKQNITFGLQRRYAQVYRRAKKLIDSGKIGPIHNAHAHFIKHLSQIYAPPVPRPTNEQERNRYWMHWRETFGDAIVETHVHSIDAINWFLGGHPRSAYGTGGRSVIKSGDIMDHVDVTFNYSGNVQASFTGSYIASPRYRDVREVFFCEKGTVETAQEHWIHYRNGFNDMVKQDSPRNVTIDALDEFVTRIQNGDPENQGIRGAESTLTAIMGRMAIDMEREVTWEEVMKS